MKCTVCKQENADHAAFCSGCGQPLREKAGGMLDKHWASAREEISRFEKERADREQRIRKSAKKNWKRWIILAVLLALGAVFVNFVPAGQTLLRNGQRYMNGWWAMEQGDYLLAEEYFSRVSGGFWERERYLERCRVENRGHWLLEAEHCINRNDYAGALEILENVDAGSDSEELMARCYQGIVEGVPAPVHHWAFEEDVSDQGGIASEVRGEAVVKGVVDSRITRGVFLDGDRDYVTAGTDLNMTENWSMTVLLAPVEQENGTILAKVDWQTGDMSYRLRLDDSHFIWDVATANGTEWKLYAECQVRPGQQWYHVTLTKQGRVLSLYVDGVLLRSVIPESDVLSGSQTVTIGDQAYHDDYTPPGFRGYIGDVAVYEHTLSDLEVQALYQQVAYHATHRWDTSYYFLKEGDQGDHFLFCRSEINPDTITLVVIHTEQNWKDQELTVNIYGELRFPGDAATVCDWYILEGETWIPVETGADYQPALLTEVISSDLMVADELTGIYVEPVLIGGRS